MYFKIGKEPGCVYSQLNHERNYNFTVLLFVGLKLQYNIFVFILVSKDHKFMLAVLIYFSKFDWLGNVENFNFVY